MRAGSFFWYRVLTSLTDLRHDNPFDAFRCQRGCFIVEKGKSQLLGFCGDEKGGVLPNEYVRPRARVVEINECRRIDYP